MGKDRSEAEEILAGPSPVSIIALSVNRAVRDTHTHREWPRDYAHQNMGRRGDRIDGTHRTDFEDNVASSHTSMSAAAGDAR
jgi:hypothetical protein